MKLRGNNDLLHRKICNEFEEQVDINHMDYLMNKYTFNIRSENVVHVENYDGRQLCIIKNLSAIKSICLLLMQVIMLNIQNG